MEALATLEALKGRLEWTLDDNEESVAEGALEDLSDDARDFGSSKWLEASSAPEQVVRLVLRAAARYMRNYEGYVQSRSADETVQFPDRGDNAGSPEFNDSEVKKLKRLADHPEVWSVPLTAYRTTQRPGRVGCVPSEGDDEPFPLFNRNGDNWWDNDWWNDDNPWWASTHLTADSDQY